MKRWLVAFLMIVPGLAGAQPVLDFRNDLAFQATTVNSFAAHIYRERLRKLKAAGKLDLDQALLKRLRGIIERLRHAAIGALVRSSRRGVAALGSARLPPVL